jgi:hypothetical protein
MREKALSGGPRRSAYSLNMEMEQVGEAAQFVDRSGVRIGDMNTNAPCPELKTGARRLSGGSSQFDDGQVSAAFQESYRQFQFG